VSKLNKLNVNYLKIPKSIAGRTKLPRGPHVFETSVRSEVCNCAIPPDHLRGENLISPTCNIPKRWKNTKTSETIWTKCVFCSYFHTILYLF